MAESDRKSFYVTFDTSEVKLRHGDQDVASVDWGMVLTAINGVGNVATCVALGASATAVCVVGRAIRWLWPNAEVKSVKENSLELSVPTEEAPQFSQSDFGEKTTKSLNKNLHEILGEEDYKSCEEFVKKAIDGIRVHIQNMDPQLPKNLQAKEIIAGNVSRTEKDHYSLFTAETAESGQTVAKTYVGANAKLEENIVGGADVMTVGKGNDAAVNAFTELAGRRIRIKVMGNQLKDIFKQAFEPETTIFEVARELKKREGMQPYDEVILKKEKKGEALDDEKLVQDLEEVSRREVLLWAEVPGKQ